MLEPTKFEKLVYAQTKKIPQGRVSTYGEIAKAIGKPSAARAVGNVLAENPYAPQVPCHRVVKSNGEVGGFAGGVKKKIAMLKKEGLEIRCGKVLILKKSVSLRGRPPVPTARAGRAG